MKTSNKKFSAATPILSSLISSSRTPAITVSGIVAFLDELNSDYLVVLNRSVLRQGYWMDFTLYPVDLH